MISASNAVAPAGVNNAYHINQSWCWLVSEDAFVQSALQGIGIAMPLAFMVLIFATRNWIVSILAVFNIVGIMLCEMGIMRSLNWPFGISESISIVIIIGFSVELSFLSFLHVQSSEKMKTESAF